MPAWDPAVYAEKHARRTVVRLRGGWLVGFNAGEWGGSLWWYISPETPGVKLSAENVISILPTQGGTEALVFVGLAHLGSDRGHVLKFRVADGHPKLTEVADLRTEPQSVLLEDDGSALVLTNKHLRRLSSDGEIANLCDVDYWGLYPRSLAVLPTGDVYVGMRHFVGRVRPAPGGTCSVEWFAPSDCPHFIGGSEKCECAP